MLVLLSVGPEPVTPTELPRHLAHTVEATLQLAENHALLKNTERRWSARKYAVQNSQHLANYQTHRSLAKHSLASLELQTRQWTARSDAESWSAALETEVRHCRAKIQQPATSDTGGRAVLRPDAWQAAH